MLQTKNLAKKPSFKWGDKTAVGKLKDFNFYSSFSLDGVDYFMYDCVYLYTHDNPQPCIGKIVKIYETPNGDKKVKLVWFFRPCEVRNFLGSYEPKWNEIFLGSGHGVGLCNFNNLESIAQKCNVVCTSKDGRNPQPSEEELRLAEYRFCCSFDVGELKVSDKFPDRIDGIKVENFFNKKKVRKFILHLSGNSSMKKLAGESCSSNYTKGHLTKDQKPIDKVPIVEGDSMLLQDRSKWFRMPWEKRIAIADEKGALVLLYVDPSYTSSEVKGLVWQGFNEKVDAKMIQQNSYSSPHYGQALVIFKSKEAAASALNKLRNGCLMLADGRPIVGSLGKPSFPGKLGTFVGHLDLGVIHAGKPRKSESMKNAVSTAHVAQANTAEHKLALEWLLLQNQSDMCWMKLHRQQKEEIENLKSKLKLTRAK